MTLIPSLITDRPLMGSGKASPHTPQPTGIFSMSLRLMPMVMVDVLLGHEPQAPCNLSLTTRPSSSTNSTLPPSAMR